MSKESAVRFLEKVRENESVQTILSGKEIPGDKEGQMKLFSMVAAEMGEDISESDFAEALEEMEAEVQQRTDAAVSDMVALDDDDIENVAGGSLIGCEGLLFCNGLILPEWI